MKLAKKILATAATLALSAGALVGCGEKEPTEFAKGISYNEGVYTVKVGNTNGISLAPTVFGPMDYGMRALMWYYGEYENDGKVKIEFDFLDDGYNATTRAVNTAQILESDEAFGIIYGYDDQRNLIEDNDAVMIYTPLTMNYFSEAGSDDNEAFFPIQPIDYVEGQQLMATAYAKGEKGFGASKVGIIAGQGSTGTDELAGMKAIAKQLGKVENKDYFVQVLPNAATTDYTSAVAALKQADCDIVLLTDVTLLNVVSSIVNANWANVDILASYKFSNALYFAGAYALGLLNDGRGFYTTGWISTAECEDDWDHYIEVLTLYSQAQNDGKITTGATEVADPAKVKALEAKYDWAKNGVSSYFADSYAMAGYEGVAVLCEGLTRLYKSKKLATATPETFAEAMEQSGVKIPMNETPIDYKDGRRTGVTAMALVKVTEANHTIGEAYRTFYDVDELVAAAK